MSIINKIRFRYHQKAISLYRLLCARGICSGWAKERLMKHEEIIFTKLFVQIK